MAITYFSAERRTDGAVGAGETLAFDTIIASEGLGNQINYDMATGIVTLWEGGYYYINWFVAPQFGFTTDGSNWTIIKGSSGLGFTGSSHTKVSATTGFAFVSVGADGDNFRLINSSDGEIILSLATESKAGIVIHKVAQEYQPPPN